MRSVQVVRRIKAKGTKAATSRKDKGKRHGYEKIVLFWIWDTKLAANLTREKIGNLSMSWNRCNAAGIGEIDVLAMFCSFLSENTSKPLQVLNKLSPLHLHLKLFDHYLVFRQLG